MKGEKKEQRERERERVRKARGKHLGTKGSQGEGLILGLREDELD